ncbi:hypothetical protein [Pontibacter mangrovi]|uniref:Lipoprotein n=1 Tax=Pontibacter mangrovi TaxID=2589816 RepID=A0A501W2G1_9BACT|nr:hypothetical protein [Pontibacter mangrovi]TPE42815.1 hypothetical protein FJM65_15925 [Pontibacter mangrovi]
MKKAVLLTQLYLLLTLVLFSCESTEEAEVGMPSTEVEKKQLATSADTAETLICPIETPCYQLTDETVKPLSLHKTFHGLVVLKAEYNRESLKFNKYEIMVAKLRSKSTEEAVNMPEKELAQLLPTLIKHVDHIELKRNNQEGCTEPSLFYLPIRIE